MRYHFAVAALSTISTPLCSKYDTIAAQIHPRNLVLLLDRCSAHDEDDDSDLAALSELNRNHFLGFDFEVAAEHPIVAGALDASNGSISFPTQNIRLQRHMKKRMTGDDHLKARVDLLAAFVVQHE